MTILPLRRLRAAALTTISAVALAACQTTSYAQTATYAKAPSANYTASADIQTLEIENFIGRVTIKTGDEVSIKGVSDDFINQTDQTVTIAGDGPVKVRNCRNNNSRISLSLGDWNWSGRSGGFKDLEEFPHLVMTVPATTRFKINRSIVFGNISDLAAADINLDHCSDLAFGDVTGPFDAKISGSADIQARSVGAADVKISGSGDVDIESATSLSLKVNGSGDFDADDVSGPTQITVNGSGDVEIETIKGDLSYRGNGSSDFDLGRLEGRFAVLELYGSGDIEIDRGQVETLEIKSNGSGDVDVNAAAIDVDITAGGSSYVRVKKASGDVNISRRHGADVKVNGRKHSRQ